MADKGSIILILVMAALGLLVLLPEQKKAADSILENHADATGQLQAGMEAIEREMGEAPAADSEAQQLENTLILPADLEASIASPKQGTPHRYFPLVAGARWTYLVKGLKYLVPGSTWTLEIVRPPKGGQPGEVRTGFDDALKTSRIWYVDGGIRLEALPYVEPVQFLGNLPEKIGGDLVPFPGAIIEGSTWTSTYKRDVIHEYTDRRGRVSNGPAKVAQTDRAEVKGYENVRLPDQVVRAARVDWEARVTLTMDGREVLEPLTTEPFRRESLWLVEGIGIVQREVRYLYERAARIEMKLIRFEYP